ncbi:MAG: hypothetical protein WAN75_08730 [Xanthobacteraceae bacterium]
MIIGCPPAAIPFALDALAQGKALREPEFLGGWRQLLAVFGSEFDIAGHGID